MERNSFIFYKGWREAIKDLPDDVIAVGNPCRVLRKITEEDRKYYFKDREFDVEDYK